MAQKTLDEYAWDVSALLDLLEDCTTMDLPVDDKTAKVLAYGLRTLHAELMQGAPERAKRARHRARKALREPLAGEPLWVDSASL